MKVTPVGKKFGKYSPGDAFELKDKQAKIFMKLGRVQEYQTRDMVASRVTHEFDSAGVVWDSTLHTSTKLKNADGTWRKKPGRQG